MSTVSIRAGIREPGEPGGQVIVDGHDLSKAVRGASIRVAAGVRPEVQLNLCVFELDRLELEHAEVIIPDQTREALIKLGWTPPQEEDR